MLNKDMKLLLDIIDKRIRKVLKEEHICYRYIAIVQTAKDSNNNTITSFAPNTQTPIRLLGFDTNTGVYNFYNRTASTLNTGDMVYIDCIGNDLNSGTITNIYKLNNEIFMN